MVVLRFCSFSCEDGWSSVFSVCSGSGYCFDGGWVWGMGGVVEVRILIGVVVMVRVRAEIFI